LGRDTVLRKTMLDECKGERLEEVLAVFSNTVLKNVLQEGRSEHHEAIARQLAYENFSYTGERTVLSALILAHKASLSKHLREKEDSRAKYNDFSNLLDLNDRRIVRRHEQLKEVIKERGPQGKLSNREASSLQDQTRRNWSGSDEWLETILYGDSRFHQDGLLATPFERVWKHVESSSIGDVEGKQGIGLLEQLDTRVRDQENRLARWQDFERTLSKVGPGSPSKKQDPKAKEAKIDLGFNRHENLHIGQSMSKTVGNTSTVSLEEYTRLIENMKAELAEVGKPQVQNKRPPRQSLRPEKLLPTVTSPVAPRPECPSGKDEGWSSVSESDEPSSGFNATKPISQTSPSEIPVSEPRKIEVDTVVPPTRTMAPPPKNTTKTRKKFDSKPAQEPMPTQQDRSPSPRHVVRTPPPIDVPKLKPQDSESDLADQILNSMSAASPSPKKQRHTLSLAERTRLSMSRASHSQYSDLHDDCDNLADLPRLDIRPKPAHRTSSSASSEEEKHANLIERTRKSMAGFEAAQKKAQMERRRSVKDAKKKQRESSYYPRLEEEVVLITPGIDRQELIEGDPDYESVFMSRPKIKTSPAVSPRRAFGDERDENELGD
jgi:hypothetical protein